MEDTYEYQTKSKNHAEESLKKDPSTVLSKQLVIYRPAQESDKNFIYSTWLKGLYYGNEWFRDIDQELYFDCYSKIIGHIIGKRNTKIFVACLREDPDIILSYAVLESKPENEKEYILHWAFTKSAWRRLGIMKDLIPKTTLECTHVTKLGRNIKPRSWIFNPFRV